MKKFTFIILILLLSGFAYTQTNPDSNEKKDSPEIPSETKLCFATAKKGDTVMSISERIGVSADALAKFNGLFKTTRLPEGREIMVLYKEGNKPSGCDMSKRKISRDFEVVTAKLGDTIETLACRHNVSPDKVAEINKLSSTSRLLPGQKVTIPTTKTDKCSEQILGNIF